MMVPFSSDLYPTGDFTIEVWVNTLQNNWAEPALIDTTGGGGAQGYTITLDHRCGSGWTACSYVKTDEGLFSVSGSASINDGSWHHVALVRNGSSLIQYIDGTNVGSTPISGTFSSPSSNIIAGTYNDGSGEGGTNSEWPLNGSIDEMRISNTARDITSECSSGCPRSLGSDGSTVAYWKFNEGSGDTTADRSGHSHTGALRNSPTWIMP